MNYYLIQWCDDGLPHVNKFKTCEERKVATCEAINGVYGSLEMETFENYEEKDLKEKGIVSFEGDPPIEWLEGEELKVLSIKL